MTFDQVLLFVTGWIVAAVLFGLWLGERGRRLDLAHIVGAPQRAKPEGEVRQLAADPMGEAEVMLREEEKERLVSELMSEGASRKDAEQEAQRIMAQLYSRMSG